MAATPYAAKLAAYSSAQAHGGVAAADPHRLIVMLMDGALERISTARGCMARGDTAEKARLINRAVSIIGELRNSLDLKAGGQIAANLGELYDYMGRRLLKATGREPRRDARRGQQAPARDPQRLGRDPERGARAMSAPIADGVMAATHKLVQQAMTGQWQEVPKTIQERRDLLDRISSSARPQDQQWLERAAPGDDGIGRRGRRRWREAADRWLLRAASPASAGRAVETTDAVTHSRWTCSAREADDVRGSRHSRSIRRAGIRRRAAGGLAARCRSRSTRR